MYNTHNGENNVILKIVWRSRVACVVNGWNVEKNGLRGFANPVGCVSKSPNAKADTQKEGRESHEKNETTRRRSNVIGIHLVRRQIQRYCCGAIIENVGCQSDPRPAFKSVGHNSLHADFVRIRSRGIIILYKIYHGIVLMMIIKTGVRFKMHLKRQLRNLHHHHHHHHLHSWKWLTPEPFAMLKVALRREAHH